MSERCWLECPSCGVVREIGPHFFGCGMCRDASGFPHWLEVRYDLSRVDRAAIARVGRVWDYGALLPAQESQGLGEGATPLLKIEALNRLLGTPNLWLKCEGVSPTGSFKDRLHTVSMAVGRVLGFRRAVLVTTGNSGVAAAAYAAAHGIALEAFVHPDTPSESRWKMERLGAAVSVAGDGTPARVASMVQDDGVYPCTLLGTFAGPANPYGVEGYKTIAFEVTAQLGRVPDRVCVPVSGGDALYGPYKGFLELRALGLSGSVPRMTSCQSEGADFVARTLREGSSAMAVVDPRTAALSIGDPTGSECIRAAIAGSAGDAWTATEDQIADAATCLSRHGILSELASAAPVAALARRVAEGRIDPEETVVAVVTATAKKLG